MIFCGRTVGCLSLSQSWSRLNKYEQILQGACGYDDDDDGDDDDDDGDVGDDNDDDMDGEHTRKILSCKSPEMVRLEIVFNLQLV